MVCLVSQFSYYFYTWKIAVIDCVFMVLNLTCSYNYINNALGFKDSFAQATPEPHTQSCFGLFPELLCFGNDQK